MRRLAWFLGLAAASLLSACQGPPEDSPIAETERKLAGTWLREFDEGGAHVRRVLVLEPRGRFRESVRAVESSGTVSEHEHSGEWLYDGTNLKRRYTLIDGKQPGAPMVPYATFELKMRSRNEFVGLDRVRGREVAYARVEDGTVP